jgi:hypothetical protein
VPALGLPSIFACFVLKHLWATAKACLHTCVLLWPNAVDQFAQLGDQDQHTVPPKGCVWLSNVCCVEGNAVRQVSTACDCAVVVNLCYMYSCVCAWMSVKQLSQR